MFKVYFEHSPSAQIVTDHTLLVTQANQKAREIFCYSSLSSCSLVSLFDQSSRSKIEEYSKTISNDRSHSVEVKLRKNNTDYWFELTANKKHINGSVLLWCINNITSRKSREKELEDLAYFDSLTGIYTRHYFFTLAEMHIQQHAEKTQPLSVLMLDLDNFKLINDTHGHSAGDSILQAFSTLVSQKLRKDDVFGRIGGEEFAVVLPNTTQDEAVLTATRICHSVEEYFGDHQVTVSIGVVTTTQKDTMTAKQALAYADNALYQVKQSGKNSVKVATLATYSVEGKFRNE
ncbi:sensor domain-containing diguanylate cyclase [Vibrio alfacsensis]|uniref:sensor domain-containing diguanylate cyclase n=1 Tax=Vibrio alfacsensis TaxID=1074311 RepID=UPI004068A02A